MQEAVEAGKGSCTAVSAHLSNKAKRRDVAKRLLGQLGKVAEKMMQTSSQATSAGLSSIEETWEQTLLTLPRDLVPMWGQMEES